MNVQNGWEKVKRFFERIGKRNLIIAGAVVLIGVADTDTREIADKMVIGNNVGLGSHGHYGAGLGGLEIGDDTIIGNYVSFHPENHIFSELNMPIRQQGVYGKGIKIGKNCWIGAKATFLDGTVIGNGCVVAAGAVVKGNFPDNSIIGGVPAKIIKMRE